MFKHNFEKVGFWLVEIPDNLESKEYGINSWNKLKLK